MTIFDTLLQYDTALLISAREAAGTHFARLIQISGELIVIWGMVVLIGLWISGVYHKTNKPKIEAISIFFTIAMVFVAYGVLNFFVPQWRLSPQDVVGGSDIIPIINHPHDNSFPSGHALFSAGLLVGLLRYTRRRDLFWITLVIALITCIARVFGGVHYPGDILGGFVIGGIVAYYARPIVDKLTAWTSPLILKIAKVIKL